MLRRAGGAGSASSPPSEGLFSLALGLTMVPLTGSEMPSIGSSHRADEHESHACIVLMEHPAATQVLGRFMVALVRDKAIRDIDKTIEGRFFASKGADKVRSILNAAGVSAGSPVTAEIVDATVCALLLALDSGSTISEGLDDDIYVKSLTLMVNGSETVVEMRGELCGWYQGSDGWTAEHSKERRGSCALDL